VLTITARRDRLDAEIEAMAADSEFTPLVRRLGCLRGVATLTGFALAVELGDWHRFTGRSIGSFVGLVPSEESSGASRVQGPITKAGNTHARRLLVEAAWHHRTRYAVGKGLRHRWALAPAAARARGDQGNRRLQKRWASFDRREKRPVIANTAIARELAGWCWSLAVNGHVAVPVGGHLEVPTLRVFGQVMVPLPKRCCAACRVVPRRSAIAVQGYWCWRARCTEAASVWCAARRSASAWLTQSSASGASVSVGVGS